MTRWAVSALLAVLLAVPARGSADQPRSGRTRFLSGDRLLDARLRWAARGFLTERDVRLASSSGASDATRLNQTWLRGPWSVGLGS